MRLRIGKKSKTDKNKRGSEPCISVPVETVDVKPQRNSISAIPVEVQHEESNACNEGSVKSEGFTERLARRFSPFRLPKLSESHDSCCEHLKEIDNLRLLVMKLNRRLYLTETEVHSNSNESLMEPKAISDWVKSPDETCILLERCEKKLEEQTLLLNEYESTIRVLRNKLESVTNEKNRLSAELTVTQATASNHSPTFDYQFNADSRIPTVELLRRENQKLAEYIQNKHKHDEKMYRLVGEQLQQMMHQVNQIADTRRPSDLRSQRNSCEQIPVTIFARDQRRKHSLNQLTYNESNPSTNVTEGDLNVMTKKLEDIENQMNVLTKTVHCRQMTRLQTSTQE